VYSPELVQWFQDMEIPNLVTDTIANEVTADPNNGVALVLHNTLMRNLGVAFTEITRTLDTIEPGQPFRIRVPENWNGVLLSDMDYANQANTTRNLYFLEQGFAQSGIQRVMPHRRYNYDPAREIADLVTVMDIFEEEFGQPDRVLQVGFSGGGNVALAMAEHNPTVLTERSYGLVMSRLR
jgi:hypothetical protein